MSRVGGTWVREHRSEIVLFAGGLTSAIALAVVYWLGRHGTNVMGQVIWVGVPIPWGAIVVGLVAASGYYVTAWFANLKVTRRVIWTIGGQLVLAYLIAEYEQYQRFAPGDVGFFRWFDAATRSMAPVDHLGNAGAPIGALGYLVRALELGGMVVAGIAAPLALKDHAYCDACGLYMRGREIAFVPGGETTTTTSDGGREAVAAIYEAAGAGDRAAFDREVAERGPLVRKNETERLRYRISVSLMRCRGCSDGELQASLRSGQGKRFKITRLGRQQLGSERVRTLFD